MSGLFRSEDMTYVRLIMNDESAYDTVRELGKFKKLHILDLSAEGTAAAGAAPAPVVSSAESSYTYYKKRVAVCQFWERKLLAFRDAFAQYHVKLPDALDTGSVRVEDVRCADVIEDCRAWLEPLESSLAKNVLFRRQHKQLINGYIEYLNVLKFNANNRFASAHSVDDFPGVSYSDQRDVEHGGYQRGVSDNRFTSTICGVLPADKSIAFERLLFRVSRGNAFCHFYAIPHPIEDPATDEPVKKVVFAVTFMGEQLARRISRIIGHNNGTEYPIPSSPLEIQRLEQDIQSKLADAGAILTRTDTEIKELLQSLAVDPATADNPNVPVSSPFLNWQQSLQKERHVCDVLKRCEQESAHSKMMTMEGWCPTESLDELRQVLHSAVRATQAKQAALQVFDHPPGGASPPTYFKTNKFTSSYQGIVDTYGVPRYKEVNPGLFTIISFPFLFGIMYGDIGHGTILFLFALYLLYNEKKFLDLERRGQLGEIPSMVFGGRYLLVLMGAFAIYSGTIYNDLFSSPVNALGTRWDKDRLFPPAHTAGNSTGNSTNPINGTLPMFATLFDAANGTNTTDGLYNFTTGVFTFSGQPYPYGVDPVCYHTDNELAFFNSMKMKLAVTLGVVQMSFGICLGALNDVHFGDKLAILFEFLPRIVFIMATFGYMVFIIIFKACIDWNHCSDPDVHGSCRQPPLLIQTMINMFLSPGSVKPEDKLYEGQAAIQAVLLLLAVFSVPVMLFPIPCIQNCRNKAYLRRHGLSGLENKYKNRQPDDLINPEDVQMRDLAGGFGAASPAPVSQLALQERLIGADSSSSDSEYMVRRSSAGVQVIDDREAERKDGGSDSAAGFASDAPTDSAEEDGGHGEHKLGLDYSYSDHLIVQGIHTIEFVLGTVSNTASYLRLWALSLAHAELSAVFWDKMIMQYGLEGNGVYWPVIGFAVWAVATFAVLLCMDTLECFLHALRLHWVEFQNKFFKADGYAFIPFSFDNLEADFS